MSLPTGHAGNADQIAYWNGPGGQRWAERQAAQDVLLRPIADILISTARPQPGERVLDVGCAAARRPSPSPNGLLPAASCSASTCRVPMTERARQVARQLAPKSLPLDFTVADATVHPFEPESFDLLVSRFGVMFFADPAASFANLRRALQRSGRMAFACWREPRQNPWMMTPLQAVYRHVPKLPPVAPDEPGPFAFASEERVRGILDRAGFAGIRLEPHDLAMDIGIGRGLDAAVEGALQIGPANRALEGHPETVRQAAANSVREALAPYVRGQAVALPAAIWVVTARAS